MKNRILKTTLGVGAAALAALLAAWALCFAMPFHVEVAPEDVSKLFLAGGDGGGQVELINAEAVDAPQTGRRQIASPEAVRAVLRDLESLELRRVSPSGIGGRAQYTLLIYGRTGQVAYSFFIADEQNLDCGRFFCRAADGALDLSALETYLAL